MSRGLGDVYKRQQSFLRHKNLNNILFTWVRTGSGTTNACMIYTNCEIKSVFIMQTLPAMLRFLFFPCINYSFNVFHPSRLVLFNLRSTFVKGKIYTKDFESPLPYKSKKGVSAVLFTTEPHCLWFHPIYFQVWECGKLSQNFKCLLYILKNNVKSSAYSAVLMVLSKRPFLAFQ